LHRFVDSRDQPGPEVAITSKEPPQR